MRIVWQVLMLFAASIVALVTLGAGLLVFVAAYHFYVAGPGSIASTHVFGHSVLAIVASFITLLFAIFLLFYARSRLMR